MEKLCRRFAFIASFHIIATYCNRKFLTLITLVTPPPPPLPKNKHTILEFKLHYIWNGKANVYFLSSLWAQLIHFIIFMRIQIALDQWPANVALSPTLSPFPFQWLFVWLFNMIHLFIASHGFVFFIVVVVVAKWLKNVWNATKWI